MTDWKQWQGRVVGESFPLTEYIGGTAESGVFLSVTNSQKLAIKLVPADASASARLAHWKLAEGLSQSHLLKIHGSGRTTLDGVNFLYLVMEYAEENLSAVLSQRALTEDEAREMLPPLLETLEFLHTKGMVHGGLKPGNIMAVGEQLKLASDDVMRAGEVANSPGTYDAPESSQGLSPASDVWSLGLTLMEVLTQQKPVSVESVHKRAETLAEPFQGIVKNSVQVNPSLRWKIADIRDYLAGRLKKTPANVAPVVKQSYPNRSKALLAVPLGLAAVVIGGVLIIPHHSKREPTPEASTSVHTSATPSDVPQTSSEAKTAATEQRKAKHTATESRLESKPSTRPETPSAAPATTKAAAMSEDGVVNKVLPDVPRRALNTITGKVRVKVRVKVDREGKVVDSELASRGPSRYFANLAMNAAKQWKFTPSDVGARAWNLQFEFRRSGAEAVPIQLER